MEKYSDLQSYKELNDAIIKQRYNYWIKLRKNTNKSADLILENIKNGYEPNEADIFELCSDNDEQIRKYRIMYELKERTKNGNISKKDFNYLINLVGIK